VKVRVLHVLEALEGGTARHVVDLVRHTAGVDHHVAIPSRRPGRVTDEEAAGAIRDAGGEVHAVEMRRLPPHPRNAEASSALVRLRRRLQPALVHGHSSVGGALARLTTAAAPTPVVYTPNGVAPSRAAIALERRLGRMTDQFVAVSESEGELVRRLALVPAHRIVVIPNGIELDVVPATAASLRSLLGVPDGAPLVGSVARLVPQKAPEVFVRACALVGTRNVTAHFMLLGGGPLRSKVEDEIRRSGLGGRFHLVRAVPEASALLDQLDVFALASRFEGGPYAPLEAMRAGTPVVVTDVVGSRDTVVDRESGLLVPADDPVRLADAVIELLDDGALRERVVSRAHARLRERFDVRAMGRAHASLYEGLTAGRRSPSR
jgi:glycosyltransferase involved in cell wall biosynthesis